MLITFNDSGVFISLEGFRNQQSHRKIDNLSPIDGYQNIYIYDTETINRVWEALDTGGTVRVELDNEGEPIGIFTENGVLEPLMDVPTEPKLSPIEQLGIEVSQREINEIIHGRQISDIEIRILMGGL